MPGVPEDLRAALAERYDLERELGHGAMAVVYLARDLRYDRRVAVKVLSEEIAAAVGRERFRREIEIVARLNHPHILPLLDSGDAGGFLYYVMPYAEGGSLRDRLERETQLDVGIAIGIIRDVALALDHAHRLGCVHRDVKPENILFSGDYALIADFGIARVASQIGESGDRLTQSGISPGTPTYMSPEQAAGEGGVDGRSDVYSLACVLYELLAGHPPFTGPSVQAVLARHRFDPVPPLRTVRRTVSVGLERVVRRALEKVPADRQKSAAEFAAALAAAPMAVEVPVWWRSPKVLPPLALVAVLAALVVFRIASSGPGGAAGVGLDTTRYMVFPFDRDSGLAAFHEEQLLQDALQDWTGVMVVDPAQSREALARYRTRPGMAAAAEIARRLGAGRFVLSQTSRIGDSLRIHAAVFDASARASPIHQSTILLGLADSGRPSSFRRLAGALLLGDPGPGAYLDSVPGTSSRAARQAFAAGLDSVFTWNLPAAESAFTLASRHDPQFPEALLWLAQVEWWQGKPAAVWQSAAERAAALRDRLPARDRVFADALAAIGRGAVERACPLLRGAAATSPGDFMTWYGLANCLKNDQAVVRVRRSPTGWGFRASYREATNAYVQAFKLLPSIHRSLAGDSYHSVRRLLWTSNDELRLGQGVGPDTGTFLAYPSWHADSLAFIPYPAEELVASTTTTLAINHERELFLDIATAWVNQYPHSADALEAIALSLAMLGNPAGLDTLRRARAFAVTPDQRVRTACAEIWMRISLGTPTDPSSLEIARAVAESLLRAFPPGAPEPLLLASVASVTGQASLAAEYSRDPSAAAERGVPAVLAASALPLAVFASLGGPEDSLRIIEQRVSGAIRTHLEEPLRGRARAEWLARPATLAFPSFRFRSTSTLHGIDNLLDAQVAISEGDSAPARRLFETLRVELQNVQPGARSIDVVLPEAWLLTALGDYQAASTWLEPTLSALSTASPEMFTDVPRPGALVRAMALRAELASRTGDGATAVRWARAVTALWSGGDSFLRPLVHRMQQLVRAKQ
jgi:tRNA A-37 threonylcarbamoyl transferase component Bud32